MTTRVQDRAGGVSDVTLLSHKDLTTKRMVVHICKRRTEYLIESTAGVVLGRTRFGPLHYSSGGGPYPRRRQNIRGVTMSCRIPSKEEGV